MSDIIKTFPTQAARKQYVKELLATNPKWALRALVVLGEKQTAEEVANKTTSAENNVGFTGFDAPLLTSLLNQYKAWTAQKFPAFASPFSPKQMAILHKRIAKYAGQLLATTTLAEKFPIVKPKKASHAN